MTNVMEKTAREDGFILVAKKLPIGMMATISRKD